jgi:hypothetical protein
MQCWAHNMPDASCIFIIIIPYHIFFVYAGSGQAQNIESQIWLHSVRWGENKWPVRSLGGDLQCRGLRPLCEGLDLVVLLLKRELDCLPECLGWWWSGWPPLLVWVILDFRIWGIFLQGVVAWLQGEKSWGAIIHMSFGVEFSR